MLKCYHSYLPVLVQKAFGVTGFLHTSLSEVSYSILPCHLIAPDEDATKFNFEAASSAN
jgi:hypothetical protein